ncbi:DUF445 domain-containing protein [Pectinatus haikarae]|uniref:DUF445 domain-containing protein n=1 Tax=Pectinatus haikarae TaxID=349096 RepID=UPI0018C7B1F4|nr:DUF445 domain-containing protein [Pectinatus haikarae]
MNRKSQATIVLIVMIAGTLLSLNADGFTGGIIHNGFLAAMIGGLADWFAITAIFKKPLGISWRTAILPRNRQRIMDEIITFIGEDLLNTSNIMKDIVQYDMSKMFIVYLEKLGGRNRLKKVIEPIFINLFQNINSDSLAFAIEKAIKKNGQKNILKDILIQTVSHLGDADVYAKLTHVFHGLVIKILDDENTRAVFEPVVHEIKEEYKEGSTLREMIIAMFDLSDENLINIIKNKLAVTAENLKNYDSQEYKALFAWLQGVLEELPQNEKFNKILEDVENQAISNADIAGWTKKYIDIYTNDDNNVIYLLEIANKAFDSAVNKFISDESAQKTFDRWVKEKLSAFVTKSSPFILQIIRDKLNNYSTDSFIALVESHISSDLQMIRINGSLVGGLAGMLLYVLTYFAERMFS